MSGGRRRKPRGAHAGPAELPARGQGGQEARGRQPEAAHDGLARMEELLVTGHVADVEPDELARRHRRPGEPAGEERLQGGRQERLDEGAPAGDDELDRDRRGPLRPALHEVLDPIVGLELDRAGRAARAGGEEEDDVLHDLGKDALVDTHDPQPREGAGQEPPERPRVADVGELVGEDERERAAGAEKAGGVEDERHPAAAARVHRRTERRRGRLRGPGGLGGGQVAEPHEGRVPDHRVDRERLQPEKVAADRPPRLERSGRHRGREGIGRELDPPGLDPAPAGGGGPRDRREEDTVPHARLEHRRGAALDHPAGEHRGGGGRRVVGAKRARGRGREQPAVVRADSGSHPGDRSRAPGRPSRRTRSLERPPDRQPARPKPPPPGVSIVISSPARRARVAFAGSSSPFRRFRPGRPGSPPAAPCGARPRRSVSSEQRQSSSTRIERTTPSPPRWRAGAARAEPQRVALDAQRIGELERLDRRVQRVRDRDVDAGGPVGVARTRPGRRRSSRSR